MWCSCARRMRMRKSSGSTPARRKRMPGVIAIVTGEELASVITPWVGVLSHLKGLKSAAQHAIAIDRVCWQGEAVAAVVATSRAVAEDAAEVVAVAYEELEAVTDMRTALDPETPVIHPSLGDNLAFERNLDAGAVDAAFAGSDEVVEAEFVFGRHTGVTLEPRAVVADWNAAEARLTIYQGTQAPHMVQNIAALHLGLEEAAGSRGLQGRRRLLRHQGSHLCRRNGDLCAVETAAAADQIRRRPGRELQHRYSRPRPPLQGADRRQARRHHHGVRDRRSHRHRSLFDVSAHQRHRGQPGRQSGRRTLCDEELSRPRPRRVPEQERDVPVPRGRPSHRLLGDRRPGRSGGGEDRHGSGRNPPPQPHCR